MPGWLPTELAGAPPGVNRIRSSRSTCGWWFVARRTGNSRHWLRCVRILPALVRPSIYIDRRNRPLQWRTRTLRRCSPCWIALSGQGVSEPAITPSLSQMFALAKRMGYEMRPIARRANQPPGSLRTPFASGQGYHPPFRQGRDFTRMKCFSAVVRWDIRKLVAQSRIWRYRSSHRAGTCSQMINNSGTPIPHRETPFRPGPHPNRSERHTSGLRFNSQLSSTLIIKVILSSGILFCSWIRILRNRLVPPELKLLIVWLYLTGRTPDHWKLRRPVHWWTGRTLHIRITWMIRCCRSRALDTGSWRDGSAFIRWSSWLTRGSSVTAMSDSLYQTLVQTGAPVGALGYNSRTLHSANGTGIGVLGCSHCVVSFMGPQTRLRTCDRNWCHHWNWCFGLRATTYLGH